MSTSQLNLSVNKSYCAKLGVDEFHCQMLMEEPPHSVRTEVIVSSFFILFNRVTSHKKLFFRWLYKWEVNERIFEVILEPVIKKTEKKESVYFDLNEAEMETRLAKIINETKNPNYRTKDQ